MDTTRTTRTDCRSAQGRPALPSADDHRGAARCAILACFFALVAGCQSGLKSITLSPASPSAALGTTVQLTAIGANSDGTFQDLTSQVTWSSAASAIAAVSNSTGHKGQVTAMGAGQTAVTASLDGVRGAVTFSVTNANLTAVVLSPAIATIAKGTTQAFAATGLFSDGTHQDLTGSAAWSTAQAQIASIDLKDPQHEVATGLLSGAATLTAVVQGKSATATLVVTDAALTGLKLTPAQPSIAKGTATALVATGTFSDQTTQDLSSLVTWASLSTAIATVGPYGLVQGLAAGSTSISATLSGQTATAPLTVTAATVASIQVTPASPQVPMGNTTPVTATGTFSDQTTQDLTAQVQWVSSDTTIATVTQDASSQWLATGVAEGTATLTASFGGATGQAPLSVSDATLTSISIAPVGGGSGMLVGLASQLVATGSYTDGSTLDLSSAVTWNTLTPLVVAVGPRGLATPLQQGPASVSAILSGVTGTADLSVRQMSFGPTQALGLPAGAGGMTIADLNGDGDLDLIATQSGSPAVGLFYGDGDGTFTSAGSFATDTGPSGVAVADLNGDQLPDVITYNNTNHTISVLLGNATSILGPHLEYADPCPSNGGAPVSLIAADFNGDGDIDIAAPCQNGSVQVLLGAGDGTLGLAQSSPAGVGAQRMHALDLNGDGNLDLLVSGNLGISLLLGSGDGSFALTSIAAGGPVSDMAAADLNGDGVTDLVALCNCGVSLMLGQPGGTFGPPVLTPVAGAAGLSLAVSDVNGDGRPDVVLTGSTGFIVAQGKGDGTLLPAVTPSATPVTQLVLGDLNGDGLPDVISTDGAKIYGTLNTTQ